MVLSVIMTLCLSASDGSTFCRVAGQQTFAHNVTLEECTEITNGAINDELLRSGKEGFATGICVERAYYPDVARVTVKYLKERGYKVEFKPYTEKK